jgi:hypothetical protein
MRSSSSQSFAVPGASVAAEIAASICESDTPAEVQVKEQVPSGLRRNTLKDRLDVFRGLRRPLFA